MQYFYFDNTLITRIENESVKWKLDDKEKQIINE